jgi:hypothetical protein
VQGQYKLCTGDPRIDGDLPRLMRTVQRWQEVHKAPSIVSEGDLCEFVSLKYVQTCSQGFRHVRTGSCMFAWFVGPF